MYVRMASECEGRGSERCADVMAKCDNVMREHGNAYVETRERAKTNECRTIYVNAYMLRCECMHVNVCTVCIYVNV